MRLHVEHGEGGLGGAEHALGGVVDEADVGEVVVAFLLERRQQERAAGDRLERDRLGQLGAVELGTDDQAGNARVAGGDRAAGRRHAAVAGPHAARLADVEHLVGVVDLAVAVQRQAAPEQLELARGERLGRGGGHCGGCEQKEEYDGEAVAGHGRSLSGRTVGGRPGKVGPGGVSVGSGIAKGPWRGLPTARHESVPGGVVECRCDVRPPCAGLWSQCSVGNCPNISVIGVTCQVKTGNILSISGSADRRETCLIFQRDRSEPTSQSDV